MNNNKFNFLQHHKFLNFFFLEINDISLTLIADTSHKLLLVNIFKSPPPSSIFPSSFLLFNIVLKPKN